MWILDSWSPYMIYYTYNGGRASIFGSDPGRNGKKFGKWQIAKRRKYLHAPPRRHEEHQNMSYINSDARPPPPTALIPVILCSPT